MDPEQEIGTDAQVDDFDQDWQAALSGDLVAPSDGTSDQSDDTRPVAPAAGQGSPAAAEPAPVPDYLLQRAKEAGFESLDDALKAARNFTSIRGQLPNLEAKWRQQHLSPLEQRLQEYESRERQALEQFVAYDPYENRPRTAQEQAYIRNQYEAEQRQQQEAQQYYAQQQQAQEQAQRQQAELAQREQSVGEMERGNLKLLAINSLTPFVQSLATTYKIPAREVQRYIDETGMVEQVKAMDDMRQVGPLVAGLERFVQVRANQLQEEQARTASAKYRMPGGGGGGAGGQTGTDRWASMNDADFERSWQRALQGNLA